ncbi:hypothetical protein [Cohnella silvisoli]|uniref:Uncharacterized protein n=1 Tax=Cohnella silvisoli TaxID=2873699 RepID=A0ABV1L3J1_9BACL|nr:hypothetical protein [Cohnella silvisoli]MCD9026446.1 hypothetical protein [Cohnella silvisoli]
MRKSMLLLLLIGLLFVTNAGFAQAQGNPNFEINIVFPQKIEQLPGIDTLIKVSIINKTDKEMHDVFTYITMANLTKTWTVNLEDYSADQPTAIGTMKPNEEKIVELPIKLVYSADYYLYATVVSKESKIITSSDAIPVKILGNTKIVPLQVQIVSILIPLLLLIALIYVIKRKK